MNTQPISETPIKKSRNWKKLVLISSLTLVVLLCACVGLSVYWYNSMSPEEKEAMFATATARALTEEETKTAKITLTATANTTHAAVKTTIPVKEERAQVPTTVITVVPSPTNIIVSTDTPLPTNTTVPTDIPPPTNTAIPTNTPVPTRILPAEGTIRQTGNLRPEPSSKDDVGVIALLHKGVSVKIDGYTSNHTWYLVRTPQGLRGWVNQSLLDADGQIKQALQEIADIDKSTIEFVQGGGIGLAVWNVETHDAISSYHTASNGNTFILIGVSIGNIERDNTPYNPLYFSLKDSSGFEYSPTIYTGTRGLQSGQLPRGEIVNGYIAFEIPNDFTGLTLSYEPQVIFGGYKMLSIPISE